MAEFLLRGQQPSGGAAGDPRPSPPTNPIPITRGTTAPMAIGGAGGSKRGRGGYRSSGGAMYSQSLPSRPRAPIIGSLPAPRMPRFAEMPALELPPSFSDDEVMRSFGAPGTSLSNSSGGMMMAAQHRGGYAASCPAPSFMMSAAAAGRRPLDTKAEGRGSGGGGGGVEAHGTGATADAQTPSFNSLVGSRTALSVLMEVDETIKGDEDGVGLAGGAGGSIVGDPGASPGMGGLSMKSIRLERIDLGGSVSEDGAYDDGGGNISSDGDDGGGLFAMED